MVVLEEIEQARERFLKYTRKAFLRLPHQERPQILDIGCGSGIPTIELAKLSNGEVTGIDIDQSCINELNRKIRNEALSNRVRGINLSAFEMKFSETFDIIWSEGVIRTIGFETSLKQWHRFLKRGGYLVIHYQIEYDTDSLSLMISNHGYNLEGTIQLPPDAWWKEFYQPLEAKMSELLDKYVKNSDALKLLRQLKKEIIMVKKNPHNFRSAFYIMKKV